MSSGKAGSVIADELGMSPNTLYNWRKALDHQPEMHRSNDELSAAVATLRRELKRVRQQRND